MEVEAEASRPARPHPQLTQLDEIGILPLSPSSAYPLAPRIPTYSCTTDGIPVVMRKKGKGRSIAEELNVREGSEYMGVGMWTKRQFGASVRRRGAGRTTLPSHSCACVGSIDANSAATTNANWRILSSLRDTPDTFTYARWRDEGVGTSPPVSPSTVDSLPLKATVAGHQQLHLSRPIASLPWGVPPVTAALAQPAS